MKIYSFISENKKMIPIEVELTLWPGLPQIQFLGLPDQHLKESALRIKSAIKAQGFEFTKSQQILVNLRPSHLKKTSRGLELAVAAAYLWETEQVKKPLFGEKFFVYGELSLSGDVFEPDDLPENLKISHSTVMTGQSEVRLSKSYPRQSLKNLRQLSAPDLILPSSAKVNFERPKISELSFSKEQAELLAVVALGGHHLLLAGPSGSGKTTLAHALHRLLPEPSEGEWLEILETQKKFLASNETALRFLPLVKPHHTTPVVAMLGGGATPMAGEISRAHGGQLLLDEFLEFRPQIQEALREPMEEGQIHIARAGRMEVFPTKCLYVATTNLCPCGDFVPGKAAALKCRFSRSRCASYRDKLSGPILDRFQVLGFTSVGEKKEVSLAEIFKKVEAARKFANSQGRSSNAWDPIEKIFATLPPFWRERWQELTGSERRRSAVLRVARSLADLAGSPQIEVQAFDRALDLALKPFDRLKRWDL